MTRKLNTAKLVALLAVLCMITSAFVGSTLAKYTTAANGSDEARVAKFGVVITANGNMFEKTYDGTVETKGEMDVVAPGTKGTMASMTLSGAPEVDVTVSYESTLTLGTGWVDKDGGYYCPVEIKVGDKTMKGTDYQSATDFANAVKTEIDGKTATYEANTDLSTVADDSVKVSWEWKFKGNDDVKDTYLGDNPDNATIKLDIKTTVTQID